MDGCCPLAGASLLMRDLCHCSLAACVGRRVQAALNHINLAYASPGRLVNDGATWTRTANMDKSCLLICLKRNLHTIFFLWLLKNIILYF